MTSSLVSPSLQGFSFFLFILRKQLVSGEADMSSGLWHDSMLPSRLEECLAVYVSPGSHWGSWLPRAFLGRPSDLWFEKSIMLLSVKMSLCFLPWRHPSELTSQHPSYYLGPPVAYRSFWTASTSRTGPDIRNQGCHLNPPEHPPPPPQSPLLHGLVTKLDAVSGWPDGPMRKVKPPQGTPGKWGPQPGVLGVLESFYPPLHLGFEPDEGEGRIRTFTAWSLPAFSCPGSWVFPQVPK